MTKFGYIRVSSEGQNIDRQYESLMVQDIKEENIYIDKASGKDFQRMEYKKLIKTLNKDDEIYIHELDRLGRNYDEIIEEWRYITKVKKADIIVLNMPLLNTTISKDLLGTFIADLVLQILSYTAHVERTDIKRRQKEGIDIAIKRGVKFGRKPLSLPEDFVRIIELQDNRIISEKEALKYLDMKKSSYYKYKKMYNEEAMKSESSANGIS